MGVSSDLAIAPTRAHHPGLKSLSLTTVGAVCALLTVLCFVVGIALIASGGVQVLIPETGKNGLDWINDVDDAGGLFFAGGWFVVIGGILALVAFVGFYALRNVTKKVRPWSG